MVDFKYLCIALYFFFSFVMWGAGYYSHRFFKKNTLLRSESGIYKIWLFHWVASWALLVKRKEVSGFHPAIFSFPLFVICFVIVLLVIFNGYKFCN